MGTASKSFDSPHIRTYFAIGIGIVGAILLIFGLIFSAYRFSSGISLVFFGLIIIIVVLIFYVVSTYGADTGKKLTNTQETSIKSLK
jgi:ABC-type transport system involved in cytochrome bd biosynthesis fused ATPase/permease subunit